MHTEHSDWRFINCWFWFRKNRNSVEFGEKGKKSWCTDSCANEHTDSPIALEANCVVAIKETPPIRDTDEYATVFAKKICQEILMKLR